MRDDDENSLQEEVAFLEKELYNVNWVLDKTINMLDEAGTHIGTIKQDMELLRRYQDKYGALED